MVRAVLPSEKDGLDMKLEKLRDTIAAKNPVIRQFQPKKRGEHSTACEATYEFNPVFILSIEFEAVKRYDFLA